MLNLLNFLQDDTGKTIHKKTRLNVYLFACPQLNKLINIFWVGGCQVD